MDFKKITKQLWAWMRTPQRHVSLQVDEAVVAVEPPHVQLVPAVHVDGQLVLRRVLD